MALKFSQVPQKLPLNIEGSQKGTLSPDTPLQTEQPFHVKTQQMKTGTGAGKDPTKLSA